jgi:ABC-2 type transport system permease protein
MISEYAQVRAILWNEFRLLHRAFWFKKTSAGWIIFLVLAALTTAHLMAWLGFVAFPSGPSLRIEATAWAFFGFLMLGASMTHAISLLYERSDLDLLISSPVPSQVVLATRMFAIAASAWLGSAFFLLPLLNAAIGTRSWSYAAGYVVWFSLAAICASLGTLLTMLVVRWLGARRARTWIQVLGAVVGASIYLTFQVPQLLPQSERRNTAEWIGKILGNPAFEYVARAARGEALPLATMLLVAAATTYLAASRLARTFLGGVQESAERKSARKARGRFRMRDGVFRATFRKEVRLILRDPLLLSQVLPSAMYVIPALFAARNFGGWSLLAPLSVVVAVQFSLLLTTVAVGGEDGLDLIRSSPLREMELRRAKVTAAMAVPVAVATLLCVIVVFLGRPGLALLAWVTGVATAAGCAWIRAADVTPSPRADILKKAQQRFSVRSIISAFIMFVAVGGVTIVAAEGPIVVAILLLGITALAVVAAFTFIEPKDFAGTA